ncbi:MAG TPA: hypothetical protein VF412_15535 [Bdellovibrio sp.]|uniref:hypothetical protein n=1 Tax=Bdellovibrio sp. TaxID=28201 RepID=UPI002EE19904
MKISAGFFVTSLLSMTTMIACSNGGGGSSAPAPVVPTATTVPTTNTPFVNGHFTYQFTQNGCDTGRKDFTTKADYCQALTNDALNNNCAREGRVMMFNNQCVNLGTNAGPTLNIMNSARCVMNVSDTADRTLLQNLNPFNPRNRQMIREIFWDGHRDRTFDIMGSMVQSYGRAKFTMRAAQGATPAEGVIGLVQNNGEDSYLVRSNLGSQMTLTVQDQSSQKLSQVVCLSDSSFKRPKKDLRQVRCVYKGEDSRSSRDESIGWDLHSVTERHIFAHGASEEITLRLKPAAAGLDERIELELKDIDGDKTLRTESSLNEGLELRFDSRETGSNIVLSCGAASK